MVRLPTRKKISKYKIVKFLNNYPIIRKSSLSLHFSNNNFKMITKIYRKNASEFK